MGFYLPANAFGEILGIAIPVFLWIIKIAAITAIVYFTIKLIKKIAKKD